MPDILPPAEGVEGSADITGAVLQDLNESGEYDASSIGTGSTVSSVIEGADAPPVAPDAPKTENIEGGAPVSRRARSAQERIAQLTRRAYQEREAKDAISQQLQELAKANAAMAEEMKNLRSARAPAPAADMTQDPTAPQPPLTLDAVRSVVGEVIQNYDQQVRAVSAQANALNSAHKASFEGVMAEFPEFGDPRSQARQVFEEVFAGSPLRTLPDAPYQIALQVRGLLADAALTKPAPNSPLPPGERKQQAAIVSPKQSMTDVPHTGRASAQRELDRLAHLMRAGNNDAHVYLAWRKLRDQLRNP